MGNIEGTKERPREEVGEQDRKREQKRKRKGERRGGEATAGKSRYVRVTWYAGVYVRAGKGRRIYVWVAACVRYVVTSGRGSKRQRGKRGPWGGGRGGEERRAEGEW